MLYPAQTTSRMVQDLSGIWDFKLDDGTGFDEAWYASALAGATTMAVPAAYNDLKEGADFRDHYGWVFYQRSLDVPTFALDQRVYLRFSAVTHVAKVYLNGELIGEHKGGFLPFEVELNDHVKPGSNLLTVAVSNIIDYTTLPVGGKSGGLLSMMMPGMGDGEAKPQNYPNFDFFNYAGIIRPVYLCTTPHAHVTDVTLVSTVEGDAATIAYEVATEGEGACTVVVRDEAGVEVARGEGTTGTLAIADVHLWEPGAAYLYDVTVTFGVDVYNLPYGVRTVEVRGNRFLINGKPFYFKGYGKHEDTFPAGRGENMPMNVKDIALMKWQGANSFRTSHYPYSEDMMRLCDREGIVVIDECPAVGVNLLFGGGANFGGDRTGTFDPEKGVQTAEHHREVIRDMIARDKNHACVVMWSIANEPDSTGEGAFEYFKPLFDLARELDPQKRPCTLVSVMTPTPDKDCSIRLSDVICLNRYYGWYVDGGDLEMARAALAKELMLWEHVGKPVIFTEFGADTVAGYHETTPVMYTEEYQVDYYRENFAEFDKTSCVIGEQVWNFADFATNQSLLRVGGNRKGIFTRDRKPKFVAHYLRQRWTDIPDFGFKV